MNFEYPNNNERKIEELKNDYIHYYLLSQFDEKSDGERRRHVQDIRNSLEKYNVDVEELEMQIDKISNSIIDQSKEILHDARKKLIDTAIENGDLKITGNESKSEFSEIIISQIRHIREYLSNERKNYEKSNFYSNVEKGSINQIFYETLIEEIPDIGLSISEDARGRNGNSLPSYITIAKIPYETDLEFVNRLTENPILKFLLNSFSASAQKEAGLLLEKQGALPKGTSDRIEAFYYTNINIPGGGNDSYKEIYRKRHPEVDNVEPISVKELKNIIREEIKKEYFKRLTN